MAKAKPEAGTFVAWDWNADRYCIDCINEMVTDEEERELLFNNPEQHPSGGPVRESNETWSQWTCSNDSDCVNSTTEHLYRQEEIGQPIRNTIIDQNQEWDGTDPIIHHEGPEEVVFSVDSDSFRYQIVWERKDDVISLARRTNKATLEESIHRDMPDAIREYAREMIEEGKEAGAY